MIDHVRQIQHESDRLAVVLAGCDSTSRVPSCPGWTALDLLSHVVTVQAFWAATIGRGLTADGVADYEHGRTPLPEDMEQLLELRREATTELVSALGRRDPAEPAWSWFAPDQTVGFSHRMQTHEATMHRVDAELAAALPVSPVPREVADDGVDHVVDVMWAWVPADADRRTTGTVELVSTDSGRRRLLQTFRWSGTAWGQTFTDRAACARTDLGVADARVAGTAHDLDLLVWGRGDHHVVRSGDETVLGELQAVLDDGIL